MSIWDKRPELAVLLRRMAKANSTAEAIANELGNGLTKHAVISKAARMHVRLYGNERRRAGFQKPKDRKKAPDKPGFVLGWNSPFGPKARHQFTEQDDLTIIRLVNADRTDMEISEAVGVGRKVLGSRITLLRKHGFITHIRENRSVRRSQSTITNFPVTARAPVKPYEDKPDFHAPDPMTLDGRRMTLADLKDTCCHWPYGTPGSEAFHFCGRQAVGNSPYCPYHNRKAHDPQRVSVAA